MQFDVQEIRKEFPLLQFDAAKKPLCYFDNAATALKPRCVIDALVEYYKEYSANVHRGNHSLSIQASEKYEQAREVVRRFLDASDEYEIIFTAGTSDAFNYVALATEYNIRKSDKAVSIVVSDVEHHSVYVPWQQVCERTVANFCVIPLLKEAKNKQKKHDLDIEAARKHIANASVLSISGMSNVTGYKAPLELLLSECKKAQCKMMVDIAQLAAHEKISLREFDCDAVAFSAHKLCGPTGVGVLCIKKEWLAEFEYIRVGGGTVETVSAEKTVFFNDATGYEAGTPNIAGVIGTARALEYLMDIGMDAISQYCKSLAPALYEAVSCIPGVKMIEGDEDSLLLSFVSDAFHTQDIAFILQQSQVLIRTGHLCAQPLLTHFGYEYVARASGYFYNTEQEIAAFKEASQKMAQLR